MNETTYHALPNSGFIADKFDEKDFVFGSERSLGVQEILAPNGQWDEWMPDFEQQYNQYFDTWSCVSYSLTNCLEFIHKRKYGEENNRSERFTSVMSGTKPRQGNSLKTVAESTRNVGTVANDILPLTPTMKEDEFYSQISEEAKKLGLGWLEDYNFGYEKINLSNNMDTKKAMEALKYSPLQTAIDPSTKHRSGFRGWSDSVVIYGYEVGKYWKVFGSYQSTTGNFDWDYPFYTPNKFNLQKKIILNTETMKFELVKGANKPEIFLKDSDGILHWIDMEETFKQYFGKKAFDNKDWTVLNQADVDAMPKGAKITLKHSLLTEAIRSALNAFGNKK